jgi:hypothetical protein
VVGIVTVSDLDARAERAEDADRRTERRNALWRLTSRLVVRRLAPPIGRIVDPITMHALDRALPDADRAVEHWRDLRDVAVVHEYLALDHLVAATLWARRAENGYLRRPPSELLVDRRRPELGLRNPLTLDEAGAVAWTRWRSAQAVGGPAPLQAAGDQFLLDTRATAPGG